MPKFNFKIDETVLVLIVVIVAMIVSIYGKLNKPAEIDAEIITNMILDDHPTSFANNGVVDENKLEKIKNMGYEDFKKSLNAKNDFCVYIEDGNGEIILSKGSSKLRKDGINCQE